MAFQPHGLIQTPIQQQLYNTAHIANVYTGIADPKENETVALVEAVLSQNVFNDRMLYILSSQHPPTPASNNRMDNGVRYLESVSGELMCLVVSESKRSRIHQEFSLTALETQAYDYCTEYLNHYQVPHVYAMTTAGAHTRLWKCSLNGKRLEPFWGHSRQGDWHEYKDLGSDGDGAIITDCYDTMKAYPPTAHAGQSYDSYHSSHRSAGATASAATASSGYTVSYSGPTGAPGIQGYNNPALPATQDYQHPAWQSSQNYYRPEPVPSTATLDANTCMALELKLVFEERGYTWYRCRRPDGKDMVTRKDSWSWSEVAYEGGIRDCEKYVGESGTTYVILRDKAKGKGKGKGGEDEGSSSRRHKK